MSYSNDNNAVDLRCGAKIYGGKRCDGFLVVRKSSIDNSLFFGCSNLKTKNCKYTLNSDISKCPTCDRPLRSD